MVELKTIRKEAKKILTDGTVKYLVGYKKSTNGLMAAPVFIKDPADVDQLIWDATCVHNLARYLLDEKKQKAAQKNPDPRPIAIFAKGCDSRAVNVLLQEKYITRDDVYIIGVSCEKTGVVDVKKVARKYEETKIKAFAFGENNDFIIGTRAGDNRVPAEELLADRCLECKANYPVIHNVLIGDPVKKKHGNYYKSLEKIESLPPQSRWDTWKTEMDKCIRCYACRSVCPMCYCEECVVDTIGFAVKPDTTAEEKAQKIKWIEKSPALSENIFYHLTRALHLAGRCIDCGECQRACPMDIPIRHLNKKMEKEAKEHFDFEAGFFQDKPSLVSSFKENDPQEFIL